MKKGTASRGIQTRATANGGIPYAFVLTRESYMKEVDSTLTYTKLHDPDRIDSIQDVKDAFVATVSHELRNPISVLLGLAQELASDYEGFSDAERREIADVMARQADDASWLIEDLLVAHREDMSTVVVVTETFDVGDEVQRGPVQRAADMGKRRLEVLAGPGLGRQEGEDHAFAVIGDIGQREVARTLPGPALPERQEPAQPSVPRPVGRPGEQGEALCRL